ncbi:MAG: hypothetical protein A2Z75_08050 [Chloroflexi bacterium RBG_13_50_10]|nr:MAG: hypothetical protein A2Z75_08050 [Chloroflexi bacterium RBG_13_50_10]
MSDWIEGAQALNRLIRPLTFPVAVKLVKSAAEFPEKTRRPFKDMGFKTNICVGLTLTRKYGWTVGMTNEDNACPIATYTYGWSESEPEIKNALMEFMKVMNYAANDSAAKTTMEAVSSVKLNKGQYAGVIFSPLERTKIEPDLVIVFCNPAQAMRLVHGATQETGISVQSLFSGRGGTCTEGILQTFKTKEPKVALPGNGDRVWAMVQDDELAFTIPINLLGSVIRGLEATHERGVRYPIPVDVRHEPTFPGQLKEVKQ